MYFALYDINIPRTFVTVKSSDNSVQIISQNGRLLSNRFDYNSFDVCVSADTIKRKEPIVRVPDGYGLSALRLCVWLFDNGYIELFYMDQGFLPTFRTE